MRSLAPVQTDNEPTPMQEDIQARDALSSADAEPTADDAAPRRRGQRTATVALLASLIWLAAASAAIYLLLRFQPAADLTLTGLAGLAAGVTAPLTTIWLVALVLGRPRADERQAMMARVQAAEARLAEVAARTRRELEAIDGTLSIVAERVELLGGTIGNQAAQLMGTAGQLEERTAKVTQSLAGNRERLVALLESLASGGANARAEFDRIIEALPKAEAHANGIATVLANGAGEARRQIVDMDELIAASQARSQEAQAMVDAAATRLTQAIAALETAGASAARTLDERTVSLKESTDSALDRTAEALEAARHGVEAQMAAVRTGTEQARLVLEGFGGDASRRIAEGFAAAAAQAERLTREMQEQEARSRSLIEAVERGFGVLDAKLSNAAQTSGMTLDRLSERLAAVREQMHELATPLGGTEGAVAALRQSAIETVELLSTALPERVGHVSQTVDRVRGLVDVLSDDIGVLKDRTSEIAAPVETSRVAIDDAVAALEAQRTALDATTAEIGRRLAEARSIVAEVEADAQGSALTATTRLVDAMVRVREVTAQAEGTMRAAIEGVIAEARETLAAAGESVVRESFTKRIRVELGEVEAAGEKAAQAAQATAERLSRQMISVAETAAAVEARIAQADARLEQASSDDLARRSNLLIEALNSASIDVAKALSTEVSDTAWATYLKGDRGIFTRRAIRLLDGGDAKAVARRYGEDAEFRESVSRYIHDFEALMRRTMAERDGNALSVALLSSDVGKLYVALAQALERIRS